MIEWQAYLISAVIGLLVGIEREKAQPRAKTMGVRTFLLLSLLGAVAGGLHDFWLTIVLSVFALTAILLSYYASWSDVNDDRGLTTEVAAALVFMLGFVAHSQPLISVLLGPLVAVVLFSKSTLHRFTQRLKPVELEAALYLVLVAVLVWNLLPDRVVGPWEVFNPRQFGLLIVILAGLEFGSYALAKLLGPERGALIVGALGGVVSSTAVVLTSAKSSRHSKSGTNTLAASTLAATLASLVTMVFIVSLTSMQLFEAVISPLAAALAAGLIPLGWFWWRAVRSPQNLEMRSPLDWPGVLRLAFLLAFLLALVAMIKAWFGEQVTLWVMSLAAMFELHGVSIATGTMVERQQLGIETARLAIFAGMTSSLLGKATLTLMIARNSFSKQVTMAFVLMTAVMWMAVLIL